MNRSTEKFMIFETYQTNLLLIENKQNKQNPIF